jgi:FkbM family methyltransferase
MKEFISVFTILKSIINHPFNRNQKIQAVIRFIKWQINGYINKWKVIYPLTNNTVMIADKGMSSVTGCVYSGLLEFEDMMFVSHFLRPDDLFVDIGANVGVYTILASGEVGSKTISIEPILSSFETLSMNVKLNNIESKVKLLNLGIGESEGDLYFTTQEGSVNHIISDYDSKNGIESVKVNVTTLDNICFNEEPNLIKIDVEGYESNVIKGASSILCKPELKGVIIELNGLGSRYGFDESNIHDKLLSYGFNSFSYEPYTRELTPIKSYGNHNTIYLRDIDFVKGRIESSQKITIANQEI